MTGVQDASGRCYIEVRAFIGTPLQNAQNQCFFSWMHAAHSPHGVLNYVIKTENVQQNSFKTPDKLECPYHDNVAAPILCQCDDKSGNHRHLSRTCHSRRPTIVPSVSYYQRVGNLARGGEGRVRACVRTCARGRAGGDSRGLRARNQFTIHGDLPRNTIAQHRTSSQSRQNRLRLKADTSGSAQMR